MEEIRKYEEIREKELASIKQEEILHIMRKKMIESLEQGLSDDVIAGLREMSKLQARIAARLSLRKAIPFRDIKRYNDLCYQYFGKIQDGEEFEKHDTAGKQNPTAPRFDFGTALRFLKEGKKLSRDGWNGKGQYIELATKINYDTVKHPDYAKGSSTGPWVIAHRIPEHDAIAFVGTSGIQVGWLASQADMLSEDWHVVEG